jgi:hypothetical protein
MRDWTLQKPNGSLESSQAKQGHEGVRQYVIPGPALRKNPPITDERGTFVCFCFSFFLSFFLFIRD